MEPNNVNTTAIRAQPWRFQNASKGIDSTIENRPASGYSNTFSSVI